LQRILAGYGDPCDPFLPGKLGAGLLRLLERILTVFKCGLDLICCDRRQLLCASSQIFTSATHLVHTLAYRLSHILTQLIHGFARSEQKNRRRSDSNAQNKS
jgi:hypothetical protein